jgi:hypothetical protein
MKPVFTPLTDPPGISVRDPIENAQFELYTDRRVNPTRTDTDQFVLPVDDAVTITARNIELPRLVNVFLWNDEERLVGESANQQRATYDRDWYSLDVDVGPMKLQVVVETALEIHRSGNTTYIEFGSPTEIALGVRSLHESPAGTITITDDVEDAMRAVSFLGSSLKTLSAERSFPTLRGHPPLVEYGDEFDVPDGISKPDSGVTIEIPRRYEDLYRVSSLAYYLGADVVPADDRALVVGDERYDLDTERGFEDEVATLLKHVFFLDCVTRTEGFYPVDLHERTLVDDALTFDPAEVYDASLAERLQAYLGVSYDVTEPHLPRWKLTADISGDPNHVEAIPFVTNELATVRIPGTEEAPDVKDEPEELASFYRESEPTDRSRSEDVTAGSDILKPRETNAIEHAWIAEGYPLGASKTDARSYQRRLEQSGEETESISIDIVCNDPEMKDEDIVEEFYGARDFFQFEITVHYELTPDEFEAVLQEGTDFLHYIGHVDEDGFKCKDGMLDARTIEAVNVDAFLLNACRSYEQGEALVERGSLGGIVTLTNISNDPAVRIGRALARLLNNGFSLQAGLSVARNVTIFGNHYITIGDGTLQLVHNINGTPICAELDDHNSDYELTIHGYPTVRNSSGSLLTLHVSDNTKRYLNAGEIDSFVVTEDELREFLNLGVLPILTDDDLTWSDELLEEQLN